MSLSFSSRVIGFRPFRTVVVDNTSTFDIIDLIDLTIPATPEGRVARVSSGIRRVVYADGTIWRYVDGTPASSVTSYQFKQALNNHDAVGTVYDSLGDIDTDNRRQWEDCVPVTPGDTLASLTQTTLGYNDAQMDALFVLARSITLP